MLNSEKNPPVEKYVMAAYGLWFLLFIVVSVIFIFGHHEHTVVNNYRQAAIHWLSAKNLYNHRGVGFIYLPSCAVLFIPFAQLPNTVMEIGWRLLSISALAYAIYEWFSLIQQKKHYFFWVTLICLPLAYSSARNGQMNLLLAALMLLSCSALIKGRYSRATIFLCLGIAFKPTMVVLLLLAGGIYFRAMWFRLLWGILIVLIFPFVTGAPSYVLEQYIGAYHMLNIAAQVGISQAGWAQLFSGFRVLFGMTITSQIQLIIRLLVAVAFFVWMLWGKRRHHSLHLCLMLYTLAALYLMLFNPRTENNDYIILGPSLAYFICEQWQRRTYFQFAFLCFLAMMIAFSYNLSKIWTPATPTWAAPVAAFLFLIWLVKNTGKNSSLQGWRRA